MANKDSGEGHATLGGARKGGGGGGGGDIFRITSLDTSIDVLNPIGPVTDLSVKPAIRFPGYEVATPEGVGGLAAVGTSPLVARGDHKHAGTPFYRAADFGIHPAFADNGPPINAAIVYLRANEGGILLYDCGAYKVKTGIIDTHNVQTNKIQFWGDGVNGTSIEADGALLVTGDLLTLDKSIGFHIQDIEISATSARANPCRAIVINGNFAAPIATVNLQDIHFRRVNLRHQFDGVVLQDSPGGLGVIGFAWDDGFVTETTLGGNAIDLATPNGEILRFMNILHSEDPTRPGTTRANSTVRIRAVADCRLIGVENVYCDHGLLVQPGFGLPPGAYLVNTVWMERCIWGQDYYLAAEIDGTTGTVGLVKMHDNYVDGIDGTHLGLYAHGGGIKGLQCTDLTALECAEGIRFDGVTGGFRFSGNFAGCGVGVHAVGVSTNWDGVCNFTNFIAGNGFGTYIDAGNDHFNLRHSGGITYCTTSINDLSGAVSKNIINT